MKALLGSRVAAHLLCANSAFRAVADRLTATAIGPEDLLFISSRVRAAASGVAEPETRFRSPRDFSSESLSALLVANLSSRAGEHDGTSGATNPEPWFPATAGQTSLFPGFRQMRVSMLLLRRRSTSCVNLLGG
jgi:hypothetical protein